VYLNVSHGHSILPCLFMRAYRRNLLRTLQRTACRPTIGSRFIEDENVMFSSQRPHTPGFYSYCGCTRLYTEVASICRHIAWRLICCIAKSTDAYTPCLLAGLGILLEEIPSPFTGRPSLKAVVIGVFKKPRNS